MNINKAYGKNKLDIVYNKKNTPFNKSLKGKRIVFIGTVLLTLIVLGTTFIIKSKSYGLWNVLLTQESTNHITIADNKLPIIQKISFRYSKEIWKYGSSITKIIFENNIHDIENKIETYDISEEKNETVIAHLVANEDNSTYTVYIQGKRKIIANSDSSNLFFGFSKLTSIEGLEYLDTSQVTKMETIFSGCTSLTSLDLSHFDTSQVTKMGGMFSNCSSLTNLDLSHFDTSKVTDMQFMFNHCKNLTNLDLSSFDTSQVTTMRGMFSNCSSLTSLDLSSLNTSQVTTMQEMFSECSSLTSLDLSSLNTSQVTTMQEMFYNCSLLSNITYGEKFIYNNAIITNMFLNCPANKPTNSSWSNVTF